MDVTCISDIESSVSRWVMGGKVIKCSWSDSDVVSGSIETLDVIEVSGVVDILFVVEKSVVSVVVDIEESGVIDNDPFLKNSCFDSGNVDAEFGFSTIILGVGDEITKWISKTKLMKNRIFWLLKGMFIPALQLKSNQVFFSSLTWGNPS